MSIKTGIKTALVARNHQEFMIAMQTYNKAEYVKFIASAKRPGVERLMRGVLRLDLERRRMTA